MKTKIGDNYKRQTPDLKIMTNNHKKKQMDKKKEKIAWKRIK